MRMIVFEDIVGVESPVAEIAPGGPGGDYTLDIHPDGSSTFTAVSGGESRTQDYEPNERFIGRTAEYFEHGVMLTENGDEVIVASFRLS